MIDSFFPETLVAGGTSFVTRSGMIFEKFEFNPKENQSKYFSSFI